MGAEWLRQRHHSPYFKTLNHHYDSEAVILSENNVSIQQVVSSESPVCL